MRRIVIVLLLFLLFYHANSQDSVIIDSLKSQLIYSNDDTQRYELYANLALEYLYVNVDQALIYLEKAMEIAQRNSDEYKMSETSVLIGICYSAKQQKYVALQHLINALELAEKISNNMLIANASKSIASIYHNLEDPLQSYLYSKKALVALNLSNTNNNDPEFISRRTILTSYLGRAYLSLDSLPQAKACLSEVYISFLKLNDIDNLAYVCNSLGYYFIRMEQNDSAAHYFQKGIHYAQEANNDAWALTGRLGLAKTLYSQQKYSLSQKYIDTVILLSNNIKIPLYATEAYQLLAEIHAKNKNFQDAFYTHKLFKTYSDSIKQNNNMTEIARLEEKLKFEKQKQVFEKEQAIKEYRRTIVYILFFAVFIVLLLFVILQRVQAKKKILERKQLSNELIYKNSELTSKVMIMLRQTSYIEDITEKLIALKLKVNRDGEKRIADIINDLNRIKDDNIWKEFEKRFTSIHPNFYERLTKDFPEMTLNEKRICAFIKMKLNTKEIAYFTQSKLNTVKVAKYRLRKKLNITNEAVSLESFIENY